MYRQYDQLPVLASTLSNSLLSQKQIKEKLYPETLKSGDKDVAETAQAEENFNSIAANSESKLLMIMEI